MDMLPTRVLSLHCAIAIAPVLTLLLGHSPFLLSDKVSAVGSVGLDLGFFVVCLFGFVFVCFWVVFWWLFAFFW